jgi:hypothetical protein
MDSRLRGNDRRLLTSFIKHHMTYPIHPRREPV